jgi:hypothetical protein
MIDVGVDRAICVWDYDNCPDAIKEFMKEQRIDRDDIDWIAIVPKIYSERWINWLEEPIFGCCYVHQCEIGTIGYTLHVGYHS